MTDLANAAADILPGSPPEGDITGYLLWRELVWGTALRLGRLGSPLDEASTVDDIDAWINRPEGARVTGAELLELAAVGRRMPEPSVAPAKITFQARIKRSPSDRTVPRTR